MADMIKGNEAIAEAAVRAGCELFAGYPITPSTEVMEYLSSRMPEIGREFIQAESELAAINMIMGFAACGKRALTASSGPGTSLKQEGISYLARYDIPCVILNVVRYGLGLGNLKSGQSDYYRDTRGGGNGGYRAIVLAPSGVQESADLMYEAFDLADKYRMVTMVVTESTIGQMLEPCDFPDFRELKTSEWGLSGKFRTNKQVAFATDFVKVAGERMAKYNLVAENEQRAESYGIEDAEYVFVAYGLPGRVATGAVHELRKRGEKVGIIRPITLWPFPSGEFKKVNPNVKGYISVELNDGGQMVDDVALSLKRDKTPIYCLPYVLEMVNPNVLMDDYYRIKANEIKEVY